MDQATRTLAFDRYVSTIFGKVDHDAIPSGVHDYVTRHLPSSHTTRIVELACGQGGLLSTLSRLGYTNCSGIDVSPQQVAQAHAAGLHMVSLGDYREALQEQDVDVVIAIDFLEHLTKSEAIEAMQHVHRVLRPGGLFIIKAPNGSSMFSGHYRYDDFTHEFAFTARSLRQVGGLVGFSSVDVYPSEPSPDTFKHAIAFGVSRAIQAVVRTALRLQTGKGGHIVTLNLVGVLRK